MREIEKRYLDLQDKLRRLQYEETRRMIRSGIECPWLLVQCKAELNDVRQEMVVSGIVFPDYRPRA